MILHVHEEVLHESEAVHLVLRRSDGVSRLEACLRAGGVEQLECLDEPRLFSVPWVGCAEAVFELEAQVLEVHGDQSIVCYLSPPDKHFAEINLLGMDFLEMKRVQLDVDWRQKSFLMRSE